MTSIAPHPGNRPALATVLAVAVLVAGAALVVLADRASVARAEADAASRLRAELGARRERVVDYLEDVGSDLQSIASSRISGTIVGEFVNALAADGDDAYANVRRAYVLDNPNPPGRRQALLEAGDGSLYSEVHSRYHDWLLSFATAHDYYDLFLVDADGRVVYSVFKEDDFGTSLVDGDYRDTALAATFERLGDERVADRAAFSDFAEYAPSDGLPAAFVGSAIRRDGRFAGALLAQLKQSRIAELVAGERTGALDARAYVFGVDGRLRSGSGVPARTVLRTAYDGPGAGAALANRSGVVETSGFGGGDVVAAYAPLRWSGVSWGIAVELDRAVVHRPVAELRRTLALALALATLLAFAAGWLLAEPPERAERLQGAL